MKDERIEALDPELASTLRRGAAKNEAPAGAGDRLAARLAAQIPGFAGGGGHGGGGSGESAAPRAPATSPVNAAPAATGVASKIAGTALIAFALGGGAGVLGTIAALSPSERVVYVERAAPAASASAAPLPPGLTTVRVEDLPIASASAPPPARAPEPPAAPASSSQLVAERQLLDEARAAFMRGDAQAALTVADRHEHDFPHGALAEEREALAIRALAALGRTDDARARAARFRTRYPRSLMLPAVEAAIDRD